MSDSGSITQWIGDLRDGRPSAAAGLWQRYYHRLVGLARKKLRDAPRRMADEEDVVLQAFHSFCRGAEDGRFPRLEDRDDLWQILVMLTARKAADQLKQQFRAKRGGGQVRGDSVFIDRFDSKERAGIDQVVGSEPTPEFAVRVADECRRLLETLGDDTLCDVAVAKMEGYTNDEIAQRLGVQTRTIERKLRLIRELWSQEE
jgi:DNA-directed RNA polymerase specialized sigma24 family protein